jgi:hypothetical protein
VTVLTRVAIFLSRIVKKAEKCRKFLAYLLRPIEKNWEESTMDTHEEYHESLSLMDIAPIIEKKWEESTMDTHEEYHESLSLMDILPIEDDSQIAARVRVSGEFRLMWAVLEDGMECCLRYATHPSPRLQEMFREAKEWIDSDEEEWLFSFISICQACKIEPDYLRKRLHHRVAELRAKQGDTPLHRAA